METVSVIVPSYRHRPFLEERLQSIRGQSHPIHELIVLDDGSDDGSAELLCGVKDRYAIDRLECSLQNGGSPFRQWAKGVALASGDYVWIAESDDSAHCDFLRYLVAALTAVPEAAFAVATWQPIDAEGTPVGMPTHPLPLAASSTLQTEFHQVNVEALRTRMVTSNPIENVSAVLFRAAALRDAVTEAAGYHYVGDWITYLHAMANGTVLFVDTPLAFHRTHGESTRVRSRTPRDWGNLFLEMLSASRLAATMAGLDNARRAAAYEHLLSLAERQIGLDVRLSDWSGRLVIYGAGAMGLQTLTWLRTAHPQIAVQFFVDQNAKHRDGAIKCGELPVLAPEQLLLRSNEYDGVLIASVAFHGEIKQWIIESGLGKRLVAEMPVFYRSES